MTMTNQPAASGVRPAAPVGIFDSGLGGLSVLRAVRAHLPGESFVYVLNAAQRLHSA
jgi:glutamate racemase